MVQEMRGEIGDIKLDMKKKREENKESEKRLHY